MVHERTIPTERPPLVGEVVPTFEDRGCRVVSATDPTVVNLGFLNRSGYFSFQVAPQLPSRGWVDPVSDPLLLRKSGSAGNRTRDLWICSQKFWPLDHRGGLNVIIIIIIISSSSSSSTSSSGSSSSNNSNLRCRNFLEQLIKFIWSRNSMLFWNPKLH
jgi:hypothetical protein